MNVVMLRGTTPRPPEARMLPSGDTVVWFGVSVPHPDRRADSVPVAWFRRAPEPGWLRTGADVVVVGSIRRRFFRSAAGVQSRTEVVADAVVPATRRVRADALLRKAVMAVQSESR